MKSHNELITKIVIPREKRFYLRDEESYYYIPELKCQSTHPKLLELGCGLSREA